VEDDTDFDAPAPCGPDDRDREAVIAALMANDESLERPSTPLDLDDDLRWAPDLVATDRVVHVELGEQISKAFVRRLRAARAAGRKIVVATTAEALTFGTLELLQELEVFPVELRLDEEAQWRVSKWTAVADWIARADMALRPTELRTLVANCLAVAEDSGRSNHARGHAYEEALCLVFSQVSWLRVVEHAYRNETEEIDVVLLVTGAGEYARLAGGPLALATAKNEKKALGSATVKYLEGQMANRRGRCKLGFACARGEVSGPAELEILGLRRADLVIVPIGGSELQELLEQADRLDERLAEMVIAATLA
jgi:hypothetical protein